MILNSYQNFFLHYLHYKGFLTNATFKLPIDVTLNYKCNSIMEILQIMLVNMINAIRLLMPMESSS